MTEPMWVEDADRAAKDARTKPQPKNSPPHWLRCQSYLGDKRCIRPDAHSGDHDAGKP